MAQDSENRFKSIMDKLYHAPKSTPNRSTSSGGKKHLKTLVDPKTTGNLDGGYRGNGFQHSSFLTASSQAPLCSPWDRRDLITRLATFKSMTWFAKPKLRRLP